MGDEHNDEVSVTARCLCGAHTFTTSIPSSSLPLPACCCHCNSCRHLTGAMYFSDAIWPNQAENIKSLKKYAVTKNVNIFSCGTCSTQLFNQGVDPGDELAVMTGALDNVPNLIKYNKHIWVGDTIDGGASMWLRKAPDGSLVKRWQGGSGKSEELPLNWPANSLVSHPELKTTPPVVPIHCHCKGVHFLLRTAHDLTSKSEAELPFFVDPETYKYGASIDGCDSCRLWFGTDFPAWTFALLSHIAFTAESTTEPASFPQSIKELKAAIESKDKDPRFGTLAFYQSSPDVERYFCSRCSASVFYAVEDRPDLVDIAVGIIDHPDGARAEVMLTWGFGRVSHENDPKGGWREGLAESVVQESEEWRIERGYPKDFRRVKREKSAATQS